MNLSKHRRSAWWFSVLQTSATWNVPASGMTSVLLPTERGMLLRQVWMGSYGIMMLTCFKESFQELYWFHGKCVSLRIKATATLANKRRSITWWWMCENDTPKQTSTPHFSSRGENGRINYMWQCQSCCLMHCSGTSRYYSDVDNIRPVWSCITQW